MKNIENINRRFANNMKEIAENYLKLAKKTENKYIKLRCMARYHVCMADYHQYSR